MKKALLILSILMFVPLFSEEDEVISIDQERSEILLYGIDSEVLELITTLKKDKVGGFNNELVSLYGDSYDDSIKIAILEYFIEMEIPDGEDSALEIFELIEYEDEYSEKLAVASINYLSEINSKKAIDRIEIPLNSDDVDLMKAALDFIGNNQLTILEDKLIEILEDEETDEQVYVEVIKTLGEVKSTKAIEKLIPIIDDEDEETTIRNAVCYSLGEIGSKKGLEALKRALENRTNYLLRKSALEALGKFQGKDIDKVLMNSLRDPNWNVRFIACRSLGERKVDDAFDILKYKALKDPEAKIKKEALRAIGDINSDQCREFLKEIYKDDKYSDTAQNIAIEKLIEYNVDWIFPTIVEYYKEKNSESRKPLLDKTLDLISKKEYKFGAELFDMMLDHENYLYKIYAIKAIRLNNFSQFKDRITDLSEQDKDKNVKKHALSALEEL